MMLRLLSEVLPLPIGLGVLFAQAASSNSLPDNWLPVGGSVVTAGILAWYVIYDVRVRTPAMQNAFKEELAETRILFAAEAANAREAFSKAREEHRTTIDSMRAAFLMEQGEMRKAFATEQAAMRAWAMTEQSTLIKMVLETQQGMRTAVHDFRDTVQPLVSELGADRIQRNDDRRQ